MARYGLPSERAFGVTVAAMRAQAKRIGRDHALAAALWKNGWYEARMMASLVDDPALITARCATARPRTRASWPCCRSSRRAPATSGTW